VLFEDNTKNRLQESVELFGDTINNPAFIGIPVMIFLNKKDLFEKKVCRFVVGDLRSFF